MNSATSNRPCSKPALLSLIGDHDNIECHSMTLGEHPREKMNQEYLYGQKDWNIRIENDTKEWIGHDRHLVVMHNQLERVEGDKHQYVKGDHNIKIDGTLSIEVGADVQQKTAQHYAHETGNEIHLKAGQKVVLDAGTELTIKGGASFVKLAASGVTLRRRHNYNHQNRAENRNERRP